MADFCGMTEEEFDARVAELRGKVGVKRHPRRGKRECTPFEWAEKKNYDAQWRAANKDRVSEYSRSDYQKHKVARKAANKSWYLANKQSSNIRSRAWARANPERNKELARARRVRLPDAARDYARKWRLQNKKKANSYQRKYRNKKYATNSEWRLSLLLRARLGKVICGSLRSVSAVRHCGMTMKELRLYIESLWTPGMSWDNYGLNEDQWSIDHIFPLKARGINILDQCVHLALCNWRNLQPLWHDDNIKKGNRVTPEAQTLFDELLEEAREKVQSGEFVGTRKAATPRTRTGKGKKVAGAA